MQWIQAKQLAGELMTALRAEYLEGDIRLVIRALQRLHRMKTPESYTTPRSARTEQEMQIIATDANDEMVLLPDGLIVSRRDDVERMVTLNESVHVFRDMMESLGPEVHDVEFGSGMEPWLMAIERKLESTQ